MKDILINFGSPALGNDAIFSDDINNMNDPWKLLRAKLFELGYNLKTADRNSLSNCAWLLFIDEDSLGAKNTPISFRSLLKKILIRKTETIRNLYQEGLNHGLKDKMALFLWEGKTVKFYNYTKQLYDKFSTIFTWNDDLVDNKKFFKFYLPIPKHTIIAKTVPFSQKKLLTNISFNKYSSYKNELYSARRKSISYFNDNHPADFDLYGLRWNRPITRLQTMFPFLVKKYSTFRGHAKNKISILSKYKFNICYENTSSAKGWVTEKIFDSLRSGTVPIYWGAENITEYVDKNAFIDRRKFKSDKELFDFLNNIDEKEYNKYLSAIEKYLTSDNYKLFLPENFTNTIIKTLNLKTNL